MVVADTSAIAHLHLEGECHEAALGAYSRDPDWLTVPLWRFEFASVLRKHRQAGNLGAEGAASAFRQALERMTPSERQADDASVVECSLREGISTYDAYFVATATELGLPLLTEDRRLRERFPRLALSLAAFAAG